MRPPFPRFTRRHIAGLIPAAIASRLAGGKALARASGSETARRRAELLTPGMNLPWWFWFSGPPWDPALIDAGYSAATLQGFFDLGIRGVRLPVDFYLVTNPADRTVLDPSMLAKLDAAIDLVLETGFEVIVDTHNAVEQWGDPDISDRLETDPAFALVFESYWSALAAHVSAYDPERVLIEVLNEPIFNEQPWLWTEHLLPALVRAIRAVAPEHTIVLSAPYWSAVDGVVLMRPDVIESDNVVFNVHSYEPFTFTHQGADWVGEPFPELHDIPYPSSLEAIAPLLASTQWSDQARQLIEEYGNANWNPDRIAAYLDRAISWAVTNEVALLVTEFGVYLDKAPIADAARFVTDVRTTLEARGVPWMVWSDRGGFGFEREDGSYVPEMLSALGLSAS